eukprot:snap_masked-scaffold_11-processed-gene-7.26-mRNA-1 protein AED:1.00 eAED:1.00 QI:0/0/0/0/1/1/2/0/71
MYIVLPRRCLECIHHRASFFYLLSKGYVVSIGYSYRDLVSSSQLAYMAGYKASKLHVIMNSVFSAALMKLN